MADIIAKVWADVYKEMFGDNPVPPARGPRRQEYYAKVRERLESIREQDPERIDREIRWVHNVKESS